MNRTIELHDSRIEALVRDGDALTIVFAHANGFPAGTYGALFEAWRAAGWRVLAPPRFGHDPAYPVTSGWPHLRDELLAFVEREAHGGPVVLVGHSMGGYLSLLAASRQPAAVSAVVLLDAPIVAGWRAHTFRMLKASGLIRRAGPSPCRWDCCPEAMAGRSWSGPAPIGSIRTRPIC